MQKGEIYIYTTLYGADIRVTLDKDSIWLDAHLIATLFNVKRPAVVKHIQNIYKVGELGGAATC